MQPVRVDGPPIEWLSTGGDGRYQVLRSNGNDQAWDGSVTARSVDPSYRTYREARSGRPLTPIAPDAGSTVPVRVERFDVAVAEWARN